MSDRDAIEEAGNHRRRSILPEVLLVAGLSLLAAWVLRSIAPPSLVRNGERLPVGLAAQHAQLSDHHGSAASGAAPSPVSDEPIAHFFGSTFLVAHLVAMALVAGIPLIRLSLARFRPHRAKFAAQLMFAGLAAVATGGAAVLAARLGFGDRLPVREAIHGGVEVTRYAFVAALAVVVIFGSPVPNSPDRSKV